MAQTVKSSWRLSSSSRVSDRLLTSAVSQPRSFPFAAHPMFSVGVACRLGGPDQADEVGRWFA